MTNKIQLKVGNTYMANNGNFYTMVSEDNGIFTDGKNEWLDNGEFLSCYEEGNLYYDLVADWGIYPIFVADENIGVC